VWSDVRKSAVECLKWDADLLDDPASGPLREAGGLHQKEVDLFAQVRREKDAFQGYDRFDRWTAGPLDRWTAEVRERERDILSGALAIETDAIGQIAKSLTAME